jgi:hypothetical protein
MHKNQEKEIKKKIIIKKIVSAKLNVCSQHMLARNGGVGIHFRHCHRSWHLDSERYHMHCKNIMDITHAMTHV